MNIVSVIDLNLRTLNLKVTYRSVDSDILNEFLIPCLQNSVLYKRAAGYFTSASLAEAARGLVGLVQNGGRMFLVASPRLTDEDKEKIDKGYNIRGTVESALLRDIQIPLSEIDTARVRNLTWMIANNKLDIRIARPWNLTGSGIYHEKIGVFYDTFDEETSNKVAFCGSMNETPGGLISNYESIDVSIGWDESERERQRVQGHVKHFNDLWEGKASGLETLEFPEAVRRDILRKYSPTFPEWEPVGKRRLRPYQEEAVNQWIQANEKGILSMATASGKTFIALKCLEKCPQPILSLIVVPSMDLATQWLDEIKIEYPLNCLVREAFSQKPNWIAQVGNLVSAFRDFPDDSKRYFVITTIQTASREKFRSLLKGIPTSKLAIVVDEVHHSGAPEFSKVFKIDADCRLGLSATPERAWDDAGNQAIFDYFGPQVFEYNISDAIKDGVLIEYQYLIHPVALDYDEKQRFRETSHKIIVTLETARAKYPNLKLASVPRILESLDRTDRELGNRLRSLYLTRIGIAKKAEAKKDALRKIIRDYQLRRCLVYCNDLEHLEEFVKIIFEEGYEAMEFSSRIEVREREKIKQSFARETAGNKFLVSVRCLDEGVDLPACDSAILVSSSRSTREFVQRRGRVLRKHPSKKLSTIHDILVLPFTNVEDGYLLTASEYDFVEAELRRVEEFATNALNSRDIRIDGLRELFKKFYPG